jgi:hypothetical protein
MKKLLAGLMLSALLAPSAYGQFLVFFDTDQSTLTPDGARVVAEAADAYQETGAARIVVTGHTDTAGSAAHNLELSQRRAEVVTNELIGLGVPATDIAADGRGEETLLVPTADGVSDFRNRRVEIVVPQPSPPAPVAAPPVEVAPEAGPEDEPRPNLFTIGPIYGHNFGETDDGGENDLVGAEIAYSALPGFLGGVSLKQAILYSFNGDDDGVNGRSVVSLDFAPDLGFVRPFLAANFGGVYGPGVQDGFVAGPEIGFNIDLFEGVAVRAKVAYDYQFRNAGHLDEGILWAGLGFGVGF